MPGPYHSGRKTALLHLLGVLFCGILVTFAVSSKVAAYYPHNAAAHSIASTKVWQQHNNVAATYAPPAQAASGLFLFAFAFAALAAVVLSSARMQTAVERTPAFQLCSRRVHAIRPPPRG